MSSQSTPMMAQYQAVKDQNPDCLLFFRLGDFYELFGEDAREASRLLNITLTARSSGAGRTVRVPMAGVPYHAAAGYIQKLLRAGKKVAICEQVADPSGAKGMMRRELVRVETPGTALEDGFLAPQSNNYVMAVLETKSGVESAFADNSTADFFVFSPTEATLGALESEIARVRPSEAVVPEGSLSEKLRELLDAYGILISPFDPFSFSPSEAERVLRSQFGVANLEGFGLTSASPSLGPAGALLAYLRKARRSDLSHITRLKVRHDEAFMRMDAATRRHLELTSNQEDGGERSTLFEVLDRCRTAGGARLLKRWLGAPLMDLAAIGMRQDAVEEFRGDALLSEDVADGLGRTSDIERVVGKIGCSAANARDLAALRETLRVLPDLKARLGSRGSALLRSWEKREIFSGLLAELESALVEDPPLSIREGGLIKAGYSSELDAIIADSHGGRGLILQIQERERLRSGNPKLKVLFNNIFGFYIEVSKSQAQSVPADYERKQTLVNAERFTTPELRDIEHRVLSADERRHAMESQIFEGLRARVAALSAPLLELAGALAELDVLGSFGLAARQFGYCRPEVCAEGALDIEQGRHPVVEFLMRARGGTFVANDCLLDPSLQQMMLITGPNMAGKSTYMRQVALIAVMAQVGSFVPAKRAKIALIDQLYTRVGAADRLSRGMSTFLVEMTETANILRNAGPRSLVVLDEIGRGTSTYDGISIAWAVAEHLHQDPGLGCRTLFATHYFELTELEKSFPRIRNFSVAVREWEGKILFQHQVRPGSSEHSYGIAVARLAGVPDSVLSRAREVLDALEKDHEASPAKKGKVTPQIDLFSVPEEDLSEKKVLDEIRDIKTDHLSPMEALQRLAGWNQELKKRP